MEAFCLAVSPVALPIRFLAFLALLAGSSHLCLLVCSHVIPLLMCWFNCTNLMLGGFLAVRLHIMHRFSRKYERSACSRSFSSNFSS